MSDEFDLNLAGVSALVFDWNGTIVDDTERARVATNRVITAFNRPPLDAAAFRDDFRLPLTDFFAALGVPASAHQTAIAHWNRLLVEGECTLQPGVRELLDTAAELSLPVGIVSAAAESIVRADADYLGIAARLNFVHGSVTSKSAALRAIAAAHHGRILYAGDTEYDLFEAQAAGAIAIGFARGYRPAEALRRLVPDAVIDDFTLLAAALRRSHSLVTSPPA